MQGILVFQTKDLSESEQMFENRFQETSDGKNKVQNKSIKLLLAMPLQYFIPQESARSITTFYD